MNGPLLRARDLVFAYDGPTVLDGVSLEVARGEFLGVIGPNGAGKSTLLRLLLGILAPASGSVEMDGDDLAGLSRRDIARRAAFLPQGAGIAFGFRVRDVVAMGRHPHLGRFSPAGEEDRAVVADAMARTGVAEMAERRVTELSGGERQRVFLARAMAQTAPPLLLDEPTANLDLLHAWQLMDLVRAEVREGAAAVAAVHDLELAARDCDRILVLHEGRVRATGAPEEVLTSEMLAEVFGVRARVEAGDEGIQVQVQGPA